MDSYDFTQQLISTSTIMDFETFTEQAIRTVLANELTQQKFMDVLADFKSFEGLNHKFCVNFTGAWLKYSLDGVYRKSIMASGNIIRDVLGPDFQQKEIGPGARTYLLSTEIYEKVNWNASELDINLDEDRSTSRKYVLMECKKTRSNNSTHTIQMILMRPKDFLEIITTSKCVSEYRQYFIAIAEIRRSYQETYLPWVIEYYKRSKLTLEQKIDQQTKQIEEMLANSYHIINQNSHLNTKVTDLSTQVSDLHAEVAEVNDKLTALFDFMLSFARMTIPTWIGSSIIKQQYDTLAINKDSTYALKHLKIMFMVGFYLKSDDPVMLHTKVVGEQTIQFKGRGNMKIYACCTNFADIGPRLKLLYGRHNNDDTYHAEMLMFKAVANTLISCEVNSERIILENADEIFPERSIVTWDSKYKSFDVAINTAHYSKAANIFKAICSKANGLRFQDYQQRIDQFDETTDVKLDPKIITYINEVDQRFFASTKPFCQQFINSYLRRSTAQDTGELVGYTYGAPTRKCQVRADLNGANMTTNAYALRKIELTIDEHTTVDHIQHMTEHGILSKEDLPALRAIAKYKNLDTTTLDEELEEYQDELDALGNH
jgi:hypothetical protein